MEKTDKCLMIIDLQCGFGVGDGDAVVLATIDRINQAVKKNYRILVLEFSKDEHGDTVSTIKEALPDDAVYLEKDYNDGSDEIIDYFEGLGDCLPALFILTGINLPYCVGETAISLSESAEVFLDYAACDDYSSSNSGDKDESVDRFQLRANSENVGIHYSEILC